MDVWRLRPLEDVYEGFGIRESSGNWDELDPEGWMKETRGMVHERVGYGVSCVFVLPNTPTFHVATASKEGALSLLSLPNLGHGVFLTLLPLTRACMAAI